MRLRALPRIVAAVCITVCACSAPPASSGPSAALAQPPQQPLPQQPPPPARAVPVAAGQPSAPKPVSPAQPRTALSLPVPEVIDVLPDAQGWGSAGGLHYLELVRGDARPEEPLPLLILIHGLGDRPRRDWLDVIDVDSGKVRMILPQAPTPYGDGFAWFEYRFRDQDPDALAQGISEATERLARMLNVLQKQRATRGRAVVCGFSQGGMLSFSLALRHPELIRYAVPISGMLPPQLWPRRLPRGHLVPLHALHGTADTVVAFDADQKLVTHLRQLGYPAELSVFEGVGHTIAPAMSQDAVSALVRALGL
jgi:phospholipase/carboxylesterase